MLVVVGLHVLICQVCEKGIRRAAYSRILVSDEWTACACSHCRTIIVYSANTPAPVHDFIPHNWCIQMALYCTPANFFNKTNSLLPVALQRL